MKNRVLATCVIVLILLSSCSNLMLFTKETRDNLNKIIRLSKIVDK